MYVLLNQAGWYRFNVGDKPSWTPDKESSYVFTTYAHAFNERLPGERVVEK